MEHNRYRLFADSPPDGPWHIYVHTPFCPRKCRFCMYYTMRSYSEKTKDALLDAVICEIRNYSRSSRATMHGATSIYLGGGTPSELGPQRVSKLLEEVRNAFPIARDVEVTLETFPDINAENVLGEYSEAGVTRISMGVQSLNAAVLDASRRPATGIVEVSNVVAACHSLGLTVNIDLMYGLPLQTQGACMDSLKTIIDTRPDHITHYRCVKDPTRHPLGCGRSRSTTA